MKLHMNQKNILKNVQNLKSTVGHTTAKQMLMVSGGLSPRFVEQLLAGTYPHKIRISTFEKIEKALSIKWVGINGDQFRN